MKEVLSSNGLDTREVILFETKFKRDPKDIDYLQWRRKHVVPSLMDAKTKKEYDIVVSKLNELKKEYRYARIMYEEDERGTYLSFQIVVYFKND